MAINVVTIGSEKIEQTVTLKQQTISKVCENMIAEMINGLPEEAHTFEAFDYILDTTKERLRTKVINLQ